MVTLGCGVAGVVRVEELVYFPARAEGRVGLEWLEWPLLLQALRLLAWLIPC